jgi:regulator of sirC expression with transglutaminase-like and TPR domain
VALSDDVLSLVSPDPRERLAAEERLAAAGPDGIEAVAGLLALEGIEPRLRARAEETHAELVRGAAYDAFVKAVPDPTHPDLWTGALALGAEGRPRLDAEAAEQGLSALVERARPAVLGGDGVREKAERLLRHVHDVEGYRGSPDAYGDPRKAFVPDVLEARRGIPVTLAVIWMEAARRLGIPSSGVGLPLHFVARCDTPEGPFFVDAFHGRILDRDGCVRLVAEAAGREVAVPDTAFKPLRPGEVLLRMLRNVRFRHQKEGNAEGVLGALDRSLHLTPLDPTGWKERAVVLAKLARPAAAARSVSRALALEPDAPDRAALEGLRRRLRRDAAERN